MLKFLENIAIIIICIIFILGIAGVSYWRGASKMKEFTLENLSVTINNKTHKCSIGEKL